MEGMEGRGPFSPPATPTPIWGASHARDLQLWAAFLETWSLPICDFLELPTGGGAPPCPTEAAGSPLILMFFGVKEVSLALTVGVGAGGREEEEVLGNTMSTPPLPPLQSKPPRWCPAPWPEGEAPR